jgi:hypothetical protein
MIRWHSKGQSCIKPSIFNFLLAIVSFRCGYPRQPGRRRPHCGANFSVCTCRRKWPCHRSGCDETAMVNAARCVVVMIALLTFCAEVTPAIARTRPHASDPWSLIMHQARPAPHRTAKPAALAAVPLPKPRPPEAPSVFPPVQAQPATPEPKPDSVEAAKPPEPTQADAPQLSACRQALTEQIAIAPSIPDIKGPGACGGTDLVRLEAVMVQGRGRVPLKPAATLRCEMATAVAGWLREDMAPLASSLGTALAELDNFDSFDCRGRNRVVGAKMSEHGRANALDIRGIKFANGQFVSLTDRDATREVREKVLRSVCDRFTTVLGPGSDGYHEDHIHLDVAERRGGYRICQWTILEPMPMIAPLMPAERPAEAPPREVAERKPDEAVPAATSEPQAEEEGAEPPPAAPAKPARKKRSRARL